MSEKLVSVCINAYNAEKYILKTVESVLNQTYKNLQIIIVDDCSTDNTYDIVKSINDERIEVYKTPFNGHAPFSCNETLKHVKGDYVAHLDADDLWAEDKIEKQVAFLEEHSEYGACFTHAEIIDESDNVAGEEFDQLRYVYAFENMPHAEMYRFLYDNANKLCHGSDLTRSEIIKKIGEHDTSMLYLHDYDYWMRLITATPIYIYPEKLTLVRRHSDNNSSMDESKWTAHNNESTRIIYKTINLCPDDLFLEAFKDKLKLQGEHTPEEVEIEKAFVLLEGPYTFKGNPVLGLDKFSKLFEDEKYIKLARDKFNFTTRDFYHTQALTSCFNNENSCYNNISLYYDLGDGFSEANKANYSYIGNFNEISMCFELPENTKTLRIDPADNAFCALYNLSITSEGQSLEFTHNAAFNGFSGDALIFLNNDPQLILALPEGTKSVTFECSLITATSGTELCKFFDALNPELQGLSEEFYQNYNKIIELNKLTEEKENLISKLVNISDRLNSMVSQKDETITELNCALGEKEDNIIELNNVIVQKDGSINELNNIISQKDESINRLSNQYSEMHRNYLAAHNSYLEITNSFFWRITSPFRKLSHKLKTVISRNRKLLEIAIFFKGFLRGGIKLGKERVKNYRTMLGDNSVSSFDIPNSIRAQQSAYKFSKKIKFSILVPLYNTPIDFLEEMIDSVKKQTYGDWELCLADGSDSEHKYVKKYCLEQAKKDKRIKYKTLKENKGISENTNACIDMATGDYIALFDHDDVLHHSVLFEYMHAICDKNADFIYCDEDKFTKFGGRLFDANYKTDFAIDNLRSNNYICHFTVFKKSLLDKVGKFRKEFDGSQDHDMILRLTEQAENIVHIPKVLYHWRISEASVASDPYAKPYTILAGRRAVKEHLERCGIKGEVLSTTMHPNIYRIKYDIIGNPLVSIIIPNYNHVEELSRCINSIINKTTYKNYEIIIVENNSNEETFKYYESLKSYENIKVVVYKPKAGFNCSAINNFGAKYANGEHYILLNNDVEIITPEWIEEMLMYSQREDVGAVGAMLYYPNDTIQHAGVIIGPLTLAGHAFRHHPRGTPGYFGRAGYQQNISAVTAACLMLKAKVYEKVEGLDESFEVAFNDIDFCMRIRKAGYLNVFTPFAELYHYESISRGLEDTPEKQQRFASEVTRFQERWKKEMAEGDPYYNPNLTLDREDFSLK